MNTLAFSLYNLGLWLFSPFLLLFFLFRGWRRGRPLKGFGERFGRLPRLPSPESGGRIWVHAVSVGEMRVAGVFVSAVREKWPDIRVVLSTVTVTGREAAEKIEGVEKIFYMPFDFPGAVCMALDRLQVSALAILETELWPNLIRESSRRDIPVVLVNGRLSERSFGRYRKFSFLFGPLLKMLSGIAAREAGDAQRYLALGANCVQVTGNMKYDMPVSAPGDVAADRRRYGLEGCDPVLVAGSTHRGEEEVVARAVKALQADFPSLGLLLAPRHLERVDEAERALRNAGLEVYRWSSLEPAEDAPPPGGRAVLLDAMGELASAYACATAAFLGGSLIPHGGQNPVEAARWGVPVLFGPHMTNFSEMAEYLLRVGGGVRVADQGEMQKLLSKWFSDENAGKEAGARAREFVRSHQGAAGRTVSFLAEVLDEKKEGKA